MKTKNITKKLIGFSLTLALTGCMGIYEGGFECPPGEGTKCKSISDVNGMVNRGEIPPRTPSSQETSCCCDADGSQINTSSCHVSDTPEIWFAPWVMGDQAESVQDNLVQDKPARAVPVDTNHFHPIGLYNKKKARIHGTRSL